MSAEATTAGDDTPMPAPAALLPAGPRLVAVSDEEPVVSLRDLFAGLAMAGIWASSRRNTDDEAQPAQIARIACATADATLVRRRRQSG